VRIVTGAGQSVALNMLHPYPEPGKARRPAVTLAAS
jgi:hypothetical protein